MRTSAYRQRFAYGRITPVAARSAVQQSVGRTLHFAQPSGVGARPQTTCADEGGCTGGTRVVVDELVNDQQQLEPCLEPRIEPPDVSTLGTPSGLRPESELTQS